MAKLGDGSVLPSNLSQDPLPSAESIYSFDVSFKQGTVLKIYYPEDPANLSGNFIEYDVFVAIRDMRSGANFQVYRNCQVSDMFGTVNNFNDFTLQPAEKLDENGVPVGGATVTLLCIDGTSVSGRALIVGGKKSLKNKPSQDRGQFWENQFNGLNVLIDKDGAYTITFNSTIDQEGKKLNEAAAGTVIKIDKDGRASISDNEKQSITLDRVAKNMVWTNGSESVTIDKEAKSISMSAGKDVNSNSTEATSVKSGKDMNLESGAAATLKSAKDMTHDAGANLNTKVASNWQVKAGGNVMVQAGGNVQIQAGGQAQLMGTINMIGAGTAPCAAVGVSMCQGVGNLGFPVISTILTGSSSVLVGT